MMHVAHRHVEERVLAHVHAAGFADLTQAQARLTARLDETGSRLTDLARAAGVTKQTAHVLVEQLERSGYVERVPDPVDGRARLIRLASRGRRVRDVARGAEAEIAVEWERMLGAEGYRQLAELLERLQPAVDPFLRPAPPVPAVG